MVLCACPLACALAPCARAQTAAAAPAPQDELYLEVTLNGEASGLIMRFTRGKTGLRSSVQNLRDLELDPVRFGVAAGQEFDLDDVKGLSYDYDAARQSIALRVSDALRTPLAVEGRSVRKALPATVSPGGVLNYDAFMQLGKGASLALVNEARYFNAAGVLTSNGVWNYSKSKNEYIRYDTAWSHADPDTLETWQVGDLISSSLTWSRSVRMGGFQWRKNFTLRPDLLTFPVASLNGSAVVPSAVSLYINGVRQVDTNVPSGPFVINQVAGINGAGQATLVTRDAAGRDVATTVPLYVDTRMMAAGLSDYSVEVGALRKRYGISSFSYERTPAVSGSLRYGVNDVFTVEAHGEAGRGVVNGGGGALVRLGQAGVVSANLSGSAGGNGGGAQAGLGYQYLSGRFSIDAQSTRATSHFSDLGTVGGSAAILASDRLTMNLALFGGQSLGFSLVGYRAPQVAPARVMSVAYSASLMRTLYLSISAYRDLRDSKARGIYAGLSMSFGDRISANASKGTQNGTRSRSLSLSRSADYGGGFGWGLQSLSNGGTQVRQGQAQYLGNYGQVTAQVQEYGDTRSNALDLAGALVFMDGTVQPARQVGAAFALVSTEGVGGVPVIQENRRIGTTDASGHLLIPNLNPYANNQIAIDTSSLPLDARIATTSLTVVPSRQSGVLARFPVEQYRAASVLIHNVDGTPMAAGTAVLHVESGTGSVLGFDGMGFIDQLQSENHLLIGSGAQRCSVSFPYTFMKGRAEALPLIGPLICRPAAGAP